MMQVKNDAKALTLYDDDFEINIMRKVLKCDTFQNFAKEDLQNFKRFFMTQATHYSITLSINYFSMHHKKLVPYTLTVKRKIIAIIVYLQHFRNRES